MLDALAEGLTEEYDQPLVWHNPERGIEPWADIERLVEVMEELRFRHDDGAVDTVLGSTGTVQGYLGGAPTNRREGPALVRRNAWAPRRCRPRCRRTPARTATGP
ncbi:MAG: hypothetical protein GEU94_02670 [Micromonosporaceae bacterium]|nr:hypothetical protein [Micromonosporaceae bacterium]